MAYMVTFTINIPQMLAYVAYMDPMGHGWLKGLTMSWIVQTTNNSIYPLE